MSEIDWSKHKVWTAEMIIAERAMLDRLDAARRPKGWGAAIEQEVKRRIKCAIATYAYEIGSRSKSTRG
jgi:hypothetical protein